MRGILSVVGAGPISGAEKGPPPTRGLAVPNYKHFEPGVSTAPMSETSGFKVRKGNPNWKPSPNTIKHNGDIWTIS